MSSCVYLRVRCKCIEPYNEQTMKQQLKEIKERITSNTTILFDLDGTLVDTDYANFLSYKKAIDQVIINNTELVFNSNDRFTRTTLERLFKNVSKAEIDKIVKLKEEFYSIYLDKTNIIEFTKKVLEEFYKSNVTVLVTNCREARAKQILNHHNLSKFFYFYSYREESAIGEHINKFENALSKLNINPEDVLVFENEDFEIQEAIKSGIPITSIIAI